MPNCARLEGDIPESLDVVEEVGEGVAEEFVEAEEEGVRDEKGEMLGGTLRRNRGESWNISAPPGETEGAGEVMVVPVAIPLGLACDRGARVGVVPTRLGTVSEASFCCCSNKASINCSLLLPPPAAICL